MRLLFEIYSLHCIHSFIHYTTLHYISPHCISPHRILPYHISPHRASLHRISSQMPYSARLCPVLPTSIPLDPTPSDFPHVHPLASLWSHVLRTSSISALLPTSPHFRPLPFPLRPTSDIGILCVFLDLSAK